MSARPQKLFRSRRGRTVAVGLAGLLAAGAVVAALTGGTGGGGRTDGARPGGRAAQTSLAPEASSTGVASAAGPALGAPDVGMSLPAVAGTPAASPGGVPSKAAASSSGPAADSAAGSGSTSAAGPAPAPPAVGPSPGNLGGPPVPAAVAAGTSRVIKNADLTVSLKKGGLGDGYQRAVDAAAAAGGWVQASQTGGDQATVTLKVPSDKLEGVVGQIRGLGKVTAESESGDDVTAEYVDLDARIAHWQAQEAVFVGLMAKAKTIPDTIEIQQQLSTIQEQIEQLDGRRKYLDGQTSYSTVKLTLLEEGAVAKPEPGPRPAASTLGRAWHRSAGAALAVLGGTLVVLGVALPLAAVVGIPAWLLAMVLRRRGGRRPEEPAPVQV
jgi:hypothetical protein